MKSLEGKVIVLTGASSGFGRGAALQFAQEGASLVLAARSVDALNEIVAGCKNAGVCALAVATDVSKPEDVENLAKTALREFGYFDVWINDAGCAAIGQFQEVPLADHIQVIKTNLLGTVAGSYFAIRHFREREEGILINVASVIGKVPAPYYGSYTASKYGVVGLDAALRQELDISKLANIHVCTVMPMAMDTPFFDHASNYTGKISEPIPPLYNAEKVVETIVGLVTRPQKEVIVGAVGKVMVASHYVMPASVEKVMGKTTHSVQIENGEPGPDTEGAVHSASGRGHVHSPRIDTRK